MGKEQLNMLINLAASDSMIAEKEARHIKAVGTAAGLAMDEIEEMIKNPEPIGDFANVTEDQRFEYLYNIVQLMKIDGQVFKSEISFCEEMAEKLGYNRKAVGELSTRIYSDPSITANREDLKKKAAKYLK